jgi:hypothetical protein
VSDWADNGQTNVDDLTLACPPDNRNIKLGGWRTQKRKDGGLPRGLTAGKGG